MSRLINIILISFSAHLCTLINQTKENLNVSVDSSQSFTLYSDFIMPLYFQKQEKYSKSHYIAPTPQNNLHHTFTIYWLG